MTPRISEFQSLIDKALEVVAKVENEELKKIAFREVLNHLITENIGMSKYPQSKSSTAAMSGKDLSSKNDFYTHIATIAGVDSENIKDLYEFRNKEDIILLQNTNSIGEQEQRDATYLVLFGYNFGINQEWIETSIITKRLKALGMKTKNLARSLGRKDKIEKRKLIIKQGEKKGTEYKLILSAKPIIVNKIKEILNQD